MFTSVGLRRVRALAAVGALAGAPIAGAQSINLSGDLGATSWTGVGFSPINSTNTTPFAWAAGNGTITGDVIVANDPTGTVFDLTITNLNYTCTATNTAGFGDVILVVQHVYVTSGAGFYTGSHTLNGSWTSGPGSVVQLDSVQDFGGSNVSLATLTAMTSPFSVGPSSALVPSSNSAGVYQIQAVLRLRTDGLGTILLPTSAHVRAALIPAPGTAGVLALVGLVASRRRRG